MGILFVKPDGRSFQVDVCDPQLNLLAHAQMVEGSLGSECGGHGICGADRIRVRTKEGHAALVSKWSESEMRHLSDRDRSEGWRLGCQCFPEQSGQELVVEVLSGA